MFDPLNPGLFPMTGSFSPNAHSPFDLSPDSFVGHGLIDPHAQGGMVNPQVCRASTVMFRDMADMEAREKQLEAGEEVLWYGRKGTPASFAFARAMAELEGGYRSLVAASGLSACVAAIEAFVSEGDHILVSDSVYGPTRHFVEKVLSRWGVSATFYPPSIGAGIKALLTKRTRLVYVESPGSMTFEVQDVPAIAAAAHRHGAVVVMDNTWGTPLFFKAFDHGVDVTVHAATKYIVGHSDATMGVITANRAHWDRVRDHAFAIGLTAGGDDLYLAMRGLRTFPLRMERHYQSGLAVAAWLAERPEIEAVLHPALPGAPGHDLWQRDFKGAASLFSVVFKPCSSEAFRGFVDHLRLFGLGFSWGGFESLVMPFDPAHAARISPWPYQGPCLRLHVGLEAVDDLLMDLDRAFAAFAKMNAIRSIEDAA